VEWDRDGPAAVFIVETGGPGEKQGAAVESAFVEASGMVDRAPNRLFQCGVGIKMGSKRCDPGHNATFSGVSIDSRGEFLERGGAE
jgi:hypothetical protein